MAATALCRGTSKHEGIIRAGDRYLFTKWPRSVILRIDCSLRSVFLQWQQWRHIRTRRCRPHRGRWSEEGGGRASRREAPCAREAEGGGRQQISRLFGFRLSGIGQEQPAVMDSAQPDTQHGAVGQTPK